MIPCPSCQRMMPDDSNFCPYCGHRRSYLRGNHANTPGLNNAISQASGTLSSYIATGSYAVTDAMQHPDSESVVASAEDFRVKMETIPTEWIQKIKDGEEAVKNYDDQLKNRELATRITTLLGNTNLIFDGKRDGAKLFREDNRRLISELYNPCQNEPEFVTKIACLTNLFEVPLEPLRNLVTDPEERRSIKLVEKWLQDDNIQYNEEMIDTWTHLMVIRNAEPLHARTNAGNYLESLNFFGINYPITNYGEAWTKILEKISISLELWQEILQNL